MAWCTLSNFMFSVALIDMSGPCCNQEPRQPAFPMSSWWLSWGRAAEDVGGMDRAGARAMACIWWPWRWATFLSLAP